LGFLVSIVLAAEFKTNTNVFDANALHGVAHFRPNGFFGQLLRVITKRRISFSTLLQRLAWRTGNVHFLVNQIAHMNRAKRFDSPAASVIVATLLT